MAWMSRLSEAWEKQRESNIDDRLSYTTPHLWELRNLERLSEPWDEIPAQARAGCAQWIPARRYRCKRPNFQQRQSLAQAIPPKAAGRWQKAEYPKRIVAVAKKTQKEQEGEAPQP